MNVVEAIKMNKFYKKYGYFLLLFFLIISLFDMRFAIAAIICMAAPVLFAVIGKGRYWCGNYCPRGNFYDNILIKISPKRKVPKFFKNTIFRIFMVLFIITNFSIGVYKNWGNLYGIGFVFYKIIVITTIVAIILGSIYNERTWCNFCPMGTISYAIAKYRGRKTNLYVSDTCVGCNLCSKQCPMGILPKEYKDGTVTDSDCILCQKCVYKCPKNSIIIKK